MLRLLDKLECERCFWLNSRGVRQPGIFPGILNRVHKLIEQMIKDGATPMELIDVDGDFFKLESREKVIYKGYTISGRLDTALRLYDTDGNDCGVCVVDWKTSSKPDLTKYERQLQVYGYMLECMGHDVVNLYCVGVWPKDMGCVLDMNGFGKIVSSDWQFTPHKIKYNRKIAESALDTAIEIIEREEMPEHTKGCSVCDYVERVKGLK